MTKRRILHPELWRHELLIELPTEVFTTAVGLHMYADDEGRESANPGLIRSALWPNRPAITDSTIDEHLLLLDEIGVIAIYATDPRRTCFAIGETWCKQNNPTPSRFPPPPAGSFRTGYGSDPDSVPVEEGGGEEGEQWVPAEGAPSGPDPEGMPPSPFCKAHPSGTERPCRNCGTARLRARRWYEQQIYSEES
ncbi:hypothetical protein [Rathayibacter sp. VKM Ac-2630]|uniref:hypothetical protein n=1 Tax=Rathayibacter sp. VKM Ac-2630 TaxID=1938617 RepID=UPI0009C8AF74|nr:hypothetical protein [Rathayibacter sp. VKM Ac-2630]OOB90315.1 hypothetical protein B0T42_12505 [Rathayibacter sp. VKM Ac-2630]